LFPNLDYFITELAGFTMHDGCDDNHSVTFHGSVLDDC